jgi:spore coat polysaccharide biosynthesis protein SpsF (cytidylyltransferase family)
MTLGKIGLIIFSRMDSKRLPGKALIDISGRPLLGRVIDRAKYVEGVDDIVVATTSRKIDDPIVSFAENESIKVYRGGLDRVADRALGACSKFKFDRFVRVCGDRPFFCHKVVTKLIEIHTLGVDLTTTNLPKAYPPGLTGEVVSVDALNKVFKNTSNPEDQEHLTRYFYHHPEKFVIRNLGPIESLDLSGLRLVVDDCVDLNRARWIAAQLDNIQTNFYDLSCVVDFARQWDRHNLL